MFIIRKLFQQILSKIEALESAVTSMESSGTSSLDGLSASLKDLRTAANRHDMAIEDLLDSWEDLQKEQQAETRSLSASLSSLYHQDRTEFQSREKALLDLVMSYHDQLFMLQRAAEEAHMEDWNHQFALADTKLTNIRLPAEFQPICNVNLPVDYSLYEVVDLVPTADSFLDHLIAEVYSCGYLYRGKILKKAKVSVYSFQNDSTVKTQPDKSEEELS